MTCDVCVELLATGVASPSDQAAIDEHLAECAACRDARSAFVRMDRVMAAEPPWSPPTNFAYRVGARASDMLTASAVSVCGVTPHMVDAATTAIAGLVGVFMVGRVVGPVLVESAADPQAQLALLVAGSVWMSVWLRWRIRST